MPLLADGVGFFEVAGWSTLPEAAQGASRDGPGGPDDNEQKE
jgi:hypothetical protein